MALVAKRYVIQPRKNKSSMLHLVLHYDIVCHGHFSALWPKPNLYSLASLILSTKQPDIHVPLFMWHLSVGCVYKVTLNPSVPNTYHINMSMNIY
jgi:hypothetical protein